MTLQGIFALFGALTAMCTDVSCGKVFNQWILFLYLSGLSLQLHLNGLTGFWKFLPGTAFPLIILFPLFIFRMIGGGDIKLLSALGGIMGLSSFLQCFLWTLVFGAGLSVLILLFDASSGESMLYFFRYLKSAVQMCKSSGGDGRMRIRPYLTPGERPENIHFTVAVFMSVMLYAGGLI